MPNSVLFDMTEIHEKIHSHFVQLHGVVTIRGVASGTGLKLSTVFREQIGPMNRIARLLRWYQRNGAPFNNMDKL